MISGIFWQRYRTPAMSAFAVFILLIYLPVLAVCLRQSRQMPAYKGQRGYRTPLTERSPAHWAYGNSLAPKVFIIADQLFAFFLFLYVLWRPTATFRDVGVVVLSLLFVIVTGCIGYLEYRMHVFDSKAR